MCGVARTNTTPKDYRRHPAREDGSIVSMTAPKAVLLDMDSSLSPTHGNQEATAYNSQFDPP